MTLTVFGIGVSGMKFLVVFLILIGFVCAEDSRKGETFETGEKFLLSRKINLLPSEDRK